MKKLNNHDVKVVIRQRIWDWHTDVCTCQCLNGFDRGQIKLFIDGVTMKCVDDVLFGGQDIPYSWVFESWFRDMPIEHLYGWWLVAEEAKRIGGMYGDMGMVVGTLSQADNRRHMFKRVRGGFDWVWDYGEQLAQYSLSKRSAELNKRGRRI